MIAALPTRNVFGDTESDGLAGPMGLLIILLLVVATVFLIRNMNSRLRRLPDRFPQNAFPQSGPASAFDQDALDQGAPDQGAPGQGEPDQDGSGAAPDDRTSGQAKPAGQPDSDATTKHSPA